MPMLNTPGFGCDAPWDAGHAMLTCSVLPLATTSSSPSSKPVRTNNPYTRVSVGFLQRSTELGSTAWHHALTACSPHCSISLTEGPGGQQCNWAGGQRQRTEVQILAEGGGPGSSFVDSALRILHLMALGGWTTIILRRKQNAVHRGAGWAMPWEMIDQAGAEWNHPHVHNVRHSPQSGGCTIQNGISN